MKADNDPLLKGLPDTASADAPAVLLPYQQRWVADSSPLKVSEKSRRTGLTWAEAADDVTVAARTKAKQGMNVHYIGYNMDMAIEYIEACAMWAKVLFDVAARIEEGEEIFSEDDPDKSIKTYTIRFASGHRIVALSSRPANLRGKQGRIVIDEAAFHDKLDELLKAALAMLIWGGDVRVISTHNGESNAFNELVQDIKQGRRKGVVQTIDFRQAVREGLFQRVCIRRGIAWTAEAEQEWLDEVYEFYGSGASEELDVVPAHGSGAWLSTALIEARMDIDYPVLRFAAPKGFELRPESERELVVAEWLQFEVLPQIQRMDLQLVSGFGMDFGRSGDLSVLLPHQITRLLKRVMPFAIELRNVPFAQQRQILYFVLDRIPRFRSGAMDARGNGQQLAEEAMQKYGASRIELVMATQQWYAEHMPPVKTAFEDATIVLPRDRDIRDDLRSVKVVRGIPTVPAERSQESGGGGKRHGDAAVAVALSWHASERDVVSPEFQSSGGRSEFGRDLAGGYSDQGFGTVGGANDFEGFGQ